MDVVILVNIRIRDYIEIKYVKEIELIIVKQDIDNNEVNFNPKIYSILIVISFSITLIN
jgi:hypothetical protein